MGPFFTADPHFGHARIIEHCNRPFTDVAQMNRVLIDNWNSVVGQGEDVYLLGDVFLKMNQKDAIEIRRKLNGNIHLILGNHDQIASKMPGAWAWVKTAYFLRVKTATDAPAIFLSHYAHRVWEGSHRGSYQLYGHSHGELPEDPNLLSFDVGVDCNNFTPVSLTQVLDRMRQKKQFRNDKTESMKRAEAFGAAMVENLKRNVGELRRSGALMSVGEIGHEAS